MKQKLNELRQQLAANGFKAVPNTTKWVNETGKVIDESKPKRRPTKPKTILICGKRWQIEKAILSAFVGVPPRIGHITHINGNKNDLRPQCLKYSTLYGNQKQCPKINKQNLCIALRCYYRLEKTARPFVSSIQTRLMLESINAHRSFCISNANKPFIIVFADWINNPTDAKIETIAKAHGLGMLDARRIIAHYLNQLTAEICEELQTGKISLQPYQETKAKIYALCGFAKPKNKHQILKQWNKRH